MFICTKDLWDDGIHYDVNQEYTGKNLRYLLDRGSIKKIENQVITQPQESVSDDFPKVNGGKIRGRKKKKAE